MRACACAPWWPSQCHGRRASDVVFLNSRSLLATVGVAASPPYVRLLRAMSHHMACCMSCCVCLCVCICVDTPRARGSSSHLIAAAPTTTPLHLMPCRYTSLALFDLLQPPSSACVARGAAGAKGRGAACLVQHLERQEILLGNESGSISCVACGGLHRLLGLGVDDGAFFLLSVFSPPPPSVLLLVFRGCELTHSLVTCVCVAFGGVGAV